MQLVEAKPASRFPARMEVRVPIALRQAVEIAANRVYCNSSEWTRQVILRALEAEGIEVGANADASPRHLAA